VPEVQDILEYEASIRRFIAASVSSVEVDDISQEVFLAAVKGLDRFKGSSSLKTWLYQIARNKVIDYYRKKSRQMSEELEDADSFASDHNGPQELLLAHEQKELIRKALQELPSKHREILILKEIEGMKEEEIAKVLEIRPGTVKSRIYRARTAFAKIFSRFDQEEVGNRYEKAAMR
jgi:RNA polymerase sigma-70 factor (ECF subfamily)